VSVSAVATVSSVVPVFTVLAAPGTTVTFPTVNPALVIAVLASALAVPSSYSWLSIFSFRLWTFVIIYSHIMRSNLLGLPKY
jgi:hypothetical protein